MNTEQKEEQFPRYTNDEANQFMIQTLVNLIEQSASENCDDIINRKELFKKIFNLSIAYIQKTKEKYSSNIESNIDLF
jgi:hypothetical protein